MCAAAGWFTRYVTCCVSSSSAAGGDCDDDVARLSRKSCDRHCRSSCHRRRRDGDECYRCLNNPHAGGRDRLPHGKSKAVKSSDENYGNRDDDKSCLPIFTATVCNNDVGNVGLMTGLEYVCCCERCDSVTGWYLTTTVPALTADQSRRQLASSLWLQNYLVACGADTSRFPSGIRRGPQSADDSSCSKGGGGKTKDAEMSLSLISSSDINGVDLLAGHQLEKDVAHVDKQYNEIVGCFRPPPNRTIGHIYLAAAAATAAANKTFQQGVEYCGHDRDSRCPACCLHADDTDDTSLTTCCCRFQKASRPRQSPDVLSTAGNDVQHLNKR